MSQEFLSLAIWEPLPGIVLKKAYGRDLLYRGPDSHYVLLRYWNSEQARSAAQEDPELLRCWARLGNEIQILKVYEKLEEIGV
jgi:hypothetical protein